MKIKDDCICVRHWDFSETSQTLGIFGRQTGIFRAIAKGSRRSNGQFSGGVDLLSRADATFLMKRSSDLVTLCSWDATMVFPGARANTTLNKCAFYSTDLVGLMLQPSDPHPLLFQALVVFLESLSPDIDPEGPLLSFQLVLLRQTGFLPRLTIPTNGDNGDGTCHFSAPGGGVVPLGSSPDFWRVRVETIRAIEKHLGGQLVDHCDLQRANRLLAAYIRTVLDHEPYTMRALMGEVVPSRAVPGA